MKFVSTRGQAKAVGFEEAVLNGFAEDGGMYVPECIPQFSLDDLKKWSDCSFQTLALNILSLYITEDIIPKKDLSNLIDQSTKPFSHPDVVALYPLASNHNLLELFHGPTLSFKDVAMGFLVNCMDYFLQKRQQKVTLLIATTGDTGPAAAYASRGKSNIDCWVLYPKGFISEEQERQITTLRESNVHAVAVEACPNGGDDLDVVIAELFSDRDFVQKCHLSSVNSVNWCRVMFQSIHYVYAYLKVAKTVGDEIVFSVPTGAFGNLFAGYLAREMGLPVKQFVCANNENGAIYRVHNDANFNRQPLVQTPSNAIDIALPYNYWRFLYFACGQDGEQLSKWMDSYLDTGVAFDADMMKEITRGFMSEIVSNEDTLQTIKDTYQNGDGYLLDPHGAVAVFAANQYLASNPNDTVVSLLTAHPAKFPETIEKLFGKLPKEAKHDSIEEVSGCFQYVKSITQTKLKHALIDELKQLNQ